MTIEEKAKRYDEAIEKAKSKIRNDKDHVLYEDDVIEIFPELKESEDEKMRRWIINYLDNKALNSGIIQEKTNIKNAIAWLEKQGEQKPNPCDGCINRKGCINCENGELRETEQKPVDKVEPKFHEGDWVVNNTTLNSSHIVKVEHGQYICDDCSFPITKENEYHLWTIQDARDGDVLCCESGWACIFKALVNDETFSSYCFMDNTKWFCETGSECHTLKEEFVKAYNGKIYPATQEQRDTFEKAMADAGYTFDFEKKKLKKIEQKPAWSEEDEKYWSIVIAEFSKCAGKSVSKDEWMRCNDWLNSLRNKVQPKQEWSEQEQVRINRIVAYLENLNIADNDILLKDVEWLKSLRPQNKYAYNPYKKVVESIAEMCKHYDKASYSGLRDFYNNVKVKCKDAKEYDSLFPQNRWKPSDEQIKALNYVVNLMASSESPKENDYYYNVFKDLREQLKKLR